MANYKHLTLEDRFTISSLLNEGASFKAIGTALNKDCTTISKEIRNHRIFKRTGAHGWGANSCLHRWGCTQKRLCDGCKTNRLCWSCGKCNSVCPDFEKQTCSRLNHPPYVCNGCADLHACTLEKSFYQAIPAHKEYVANLSETRQGISLSEAEVKHLDGLISPLIKKGQSLNHICINNQDSIMVSESTLYRLIDYGAFTAINMDLPRKVRYAKRKVKKHIKIDRQCRCGRTYRDFRAFMEKHPDLPITEIDTVEGTRGGKVLLTIHFVKTELMLAFLRDTNDSQSVIDIFERLYFELRPDIFMQLMPVLLGDNGSEFSNPTAIENDRQGNHRTNLFYCDPASPGQKGSAERNHEFIRCFIPKGTSLDSYTQSDIDLMMDQINSYCRESLGNKSPYDVFRFLYGEEVLKLLGCHSVKPNDVILNASIFKNEDEK